MNGEWMNEQCPLLPSRRAPAKPGKGLDQTHKRASPADTVLLPPLPVAHKPLLESVRDSLTSRARYRAKSREEGRSLNKWRRDEYH
jgi:hypothetical protein